MTDSSGAVVVGAKITMRNVSAPLPHFIETFMDNGYYDMYKIMKALRDVDFDGIVIPDHVPRMGPAPTAGAPDRGGNDAYGRAALAFSVSYMRALRDRANREARGRREPQARTAQADTPILAASASRRGAGKLAEQTLSFMPPRPQEVADFCSANAPGS